MSLSATALAISLEFLKDFEGWHSLFCLCLYPYNIGEVGGWVRELMDDSHLSFVFSSPCENRVLTSLRHGLIFLLKLS